MGFANISSLSFLEAWCVATAYALQLYFDFSGYTDMAVASAMLLGIDIPRNFDSPFKSLSIIEFWQRWHISLSSFITTYLYTPILRLFPSATLATAAVATFVAMCIAGLWHGPNWTFVIFGAIHGAGLVINQYWKKKKMPALPDWICWLLTFALLDIGFVFFRSPNLHIAAQFIARMSSVHQSFGFANIAQLSMEDLMAKVFALLQVAGIFVVFVCKSSSQLDREFKLSWGSSALTAGCAIVALIYLNSSVSAPFVYFAF
jgi:D-alanyl-lipoteichoic acid acyltransferase DltB (MBOAT superfamily)